MFFRSSHPGVAYSTVPRRRIRRERRPQLRPGLEALEDRTLLSLGFNSPLNLDTYAWVKEKPTDTLLPRDPLLNPADPVTIQYNWLQGRSPDAVAVGDFDRDGIPDFAVADANAGAPGKISVFHGNGDGTFDHTQPRVDLTQNTIHLLDSGGIAPSGLVAARLRGGNQPLDLIVVNSGDDFGNGANVSVLLGNGDGNFQAAQTYVLSDVLKNGAVLQPTALAVGDFNGDGHVDVVVTTKTSFPGVAIVLFGDGNGGFFPNTAPTGQRPVELLLSTDSVFPSSVAVGDFNGDGHDDFVTANTGSNDVTVVQSNGDGINFTLAGLYATGGAPVSVQVARMIPTGGPLDIITANNLGNNVSILFGKGDGTFGLPDDPDLSVRPAVFDAGLTPTSVVVGNFDGAGPGLAVTNGEDSSASSNSVSVLTFNPNHLKDNSDLLFPPVSYRTGVHPVALATAQLRPDMPGVMDLVVANLGSTLDRGSVSVLLNESRSVVHHRDTLLFPTPTDIPAGVQPDSIAIGDFNGDGLPDFVVANSVSNDLTVWLNDRDNPGYAFLPLTDLDGNPLPLTVPLPPLFAIMGPKKVLVVDINGDNLPDIVVASFGDFGIREGNVTAFLNTGKKDHPFNILLKIGDPANPTLILDTDHVKQFEPMGQFEPPGLVYFLDMAVGHFGSDKKLGFAVLFFNEVANRFGVAVLFADGTVGRDTLLLAGSNPTSIAVADFNNDGMDDVAVTNNKDDARADSVSVLFGTPDGGFMPSGDYKAGSHVQAVAAMQLRGDDHPFVDLVVVNENFPGGVTILFNNGDGHFDPPPGGYPLYFAGTNPFALVVQDLNGDGVPDIAVANINGDSVSVLLGKKSDPGKFEDTVAYVTGGFPTAIAADDFFHHTDGRLDLITSNIASNDVSVIEDLEPPPSPGGGAAAAPPSGRQSQSGLGYQSQSGGLALSNLDHFFVVLGDAGPELAAPVRQSDARTPSDSWHPLARPRPVGESEMFTTLLWEEMPSGL